MSQGAGLGLGYDHVSDCYLSDAAPQRQQERFARPKHLGSTHLVSVATVLSWRFTTGQGLSYTGSYCLSDV